MAGNSMMSFEEFQVFLSKVLDVPASELTWGTSFLNDLAVDSLKLVELMLQFELQLGMDVPAEVAWEIQTVGDAYQLYTRFSQGSAAPA